MDGNHKRVAGCGSGKLPGMSGSKRSIPKAKPHAFISRELPTAHQRVVTPAAAKLRIVTIQGVNLEDQPCIVTDAAPQSEIEQNLRRGNIALFQQSQQAF